MTDPPESLGIEELVSANVPSLGMGGQADSVRLISLKNDANTQYVFKSYDEDNRGKVDGSALADYVCWRRELPPEERVKLDSVCAWPISLVTEENRTRGFIMQPAERVMWRPQSATMPRKLRFIDRLMVREHRCEPAEEYVSIPRKLAILADVAKVMLWMHTHGYAIGDLQPRNTVFELSRAGHVYFLDCDSFACLTGPSPFRPADPLDYRVAWADSFTPSTDYAKLSLITTQSLLETTQPVDFDNPQLKSFIHTAAINLLRESWSGPDVSGDRSARWDELATTWQSLVRENRDYVRVDGSLYVPWPLTPSPTSAAAPAPAPAPVPTLGGLPSSARSRRRPPPSRTPGPRPPLPPSQPPRPSPRRVWPWAVLLFLAVPVLAVVLLVLFN